MIIKKSFRRTVSVVIVAFCVFLSFSISSSALTLFDYNKVNMTDAMGRGDKRYEQEFLSITELNDYRTEAEGKYFYQPLYEYYSGGEENLTNESTPDYVLIYAGQAISGPAYVYGLYGDYIVSSGGYNVPYTLGYCVYLPEDSEVLSLREAYDSGIENIECVFTDYGLGKMIGDVDGDRNLTIKDATYIQKCLAGIMSFPVDDEIMGSCETSDDISPDKYSRYISDFDNNDVRNIKDATAIQKCIAGLPY